MRTQTLSLALLSATLVLPTVTAQQTAPQLEVATDHENRRDERAPIELEKLAFLVGDWQIRSRYRQADGSSLESEGRMSGRYSLGGFAIETQSIHPALANPDIDIFVGTHTYVIHPKTGAVAGIAINTLGNRKFNDGELVNGEFIVIQSGEMFGGAKVINRSRFFNVTQDRFETTLEVSKDGGKTWLDGGYSSVLVRSR